MKFDLIPQDKETIYRKYLLELVEKIKRRYHDSGLMASGEFEKQLEILIEGDKLSILGAKHSVDMDQGKKPGFVSSKDIYNWIMVKKGLPTVFYKRPEFYAFIIAKKITEHGIRVPNKFNKGRLISEVIDDFLENDLKKMLAELGIKSIGRINSDLTQIFKIVA
ncbi:hypothetical protein [Epilithonimonas sp. UC225_85]|uniref:hypothetical protein n=1 Tax=Epilithonimonas sp. UC225_85 TaxID=3350167 RepID=UPI0036D2687E